MVVLYFQQLLACKEFWVRAAYALVVICWSGLFCFPKVNLLNRLKKEKKNVYFYRLSAQNWGEMCRALYNDSVNGRQSWRKAWDLIYSLSPHILKPQREEVGEDAEQVRWAKAMEKLEDFMGIVTTPALTLWLRVWIWISWPIWEISFSNSMKSEWEILQTVLREEESLVAVLGEILKKL